MNDQINVQAINTRLAGVALRSAVESANLVLDCTDNLDTRFMINEACVATQTPLVSGAAVRWEGQVSVFNSVVGGACYQCLYKPDQHIAGNCAESGVISPLVGIIGATQALEAIKLITQAGRSLQNRLLLLDAKSMQWREILLEADPGCRVCGNSSRNSSE